MTEGRTRARTTQVALASHIRPGDQVSLSSGLCEKQVSRLMVVR